MMPRRKGAPISKTSHRSAIFLPGELLLYQTAFPPWTLPMRLVLHLKRLKLQTFRYYLRSSKSARLRLLRADMQKRITTGPRMVPRVTTKSTISKVAEHRCQSNRHKAKIMVVAPSKSPMTRTKSLVPQQTALDPGRIPKVDGRGRTARRHRSRNLQASLCLRMSQIERAVKSVKSVRETTCKLCKLSSL